MAKCKSGFFSWPRILLVLGLFLRSTGAQQLQESHAADLLRELKSTTTTETVTMASGSMPPPTSKTAALSFEEQQRKQELLNKYKHEPLAITMDSIFPSQGPTSGETRVLVRGGPFQDMHLIYPHPKCKFGKRDMIVNAVYVSCTARPLSVEEVEGKKANRDQICIQCENSPKHDKAEIVQLLVSLTGDFSDAADGEAFRYYLEPEVHAIYPRYGVKDGGTTVEVWGKNFMNFGAHTRCGFGTKTVQANYYNSTYLTCSARPSDVVEKPIPFTVSMNQQQNTRQAINYWYYNNPIVSELQPNYGVFQGGQEVIVIGSGFYPFDYKNGLDINNKNDTFCRFEQLDVQVPMEVLSATRGKCVAPANAMGIDSTFVEVALNNRDWSDDNVPYFYYKRKRIANAEPDEACLTCGGNTTISGIETEPGKNIICYWGDKQTPGRVGGYGQVVCETPKVSEPGCYRLSIGYEGEDQRFNSESVQFCFYELPKVASISPTCGPASGFTQLTVKGQNFANKGFGKAKCVFNDTIFMNATIVDDQTIKCSTPFLANEDHGFEPQYEFMTVKVTLNGFELSETMQKFSYYPNIKITEVDNNIGPLSGGTPLVLGGIGLGHPNICNPKVKFGAIEMTPTVVDGAFLSVKTPAVAYPGAVTIFPSGNGQNYGPDKTLHFRDEENTFTYIQDVFVQDFQPETGPSTGKTVVTARGYGFQQIKFANGTVDSQDFLVRFVDMNKKQIGENIPVQASSETSFSFETPSAPGGTKVIIQISYNEVDWQSLIPEGKDYSFLFYTAPTLTQITPRYGPVKESKDVKIIGKNFVCSDDECSKLVVRFGSDEDAMLVSAKLLSASEIQVTVPAYTKPDVLSISVSFNGVDFTKSSLKYGYFDPFVIRVDPQIIPTDKISQGTIHGFGFINPDSPSDLKIKFTSPSGDLQCAKQDCVVMGTYVNKHTITYNNKLLSELTYKDGKHVKPSEPIFVEVSLMSNSYTNQKVPVYFFYQPSWNSVAPSSVPQNLDQHIRVETDFGWSQNSFAQMMKYSNFTCMFTIGSETHVTQGRMETLPLGSLYDSDKTNDKPTHVVCQTPKTQNTGSSELKLSANGKDYSGSLNFNFSPLLELYKVTPMAGPLEKSTKVKLIGKGFDAQKDKVYTKFGTQATQEIVASQVKKQSWNFVQYLESMNMNLADMRSYESREVWIKDGDQLDSTVVQTPALSKTQMQGHVYLSVGQVDKTEFILPNGTSANTSLYHFSNDLVDFTYYKQPQVVKIEPETGLNVGGTLIEISGIWFDYKPQYGIVPACKIGDKIVRATFSSTVRITCVAPPNENIYRKLPVYVSLNGVDWVDSGSTYSYYIQPAISSIEPKVGAVNSGDIVFIKGDNFSNMTDPEQTKCRWTSLNNVLGVEHPQFREFTPAVYRNKTHMYCMMPGHFVGGDRAHIQLTFNNIDYSDVSDNLIFQFYAIDSVFPKSGPANSKDPILVKGSGFMTKSRIICSLNMTEQVALEVTPTQIKCPMTWPGKDKNATGTVKFGIKIDDGWTDLGSFHFYTQVALNDVMPRFGPAEGRGLIYLTGQRFANDFPNAELGCKIGKSIGKGTLLDPETIVCTVESIELVNQGQVLPVFVALNSYSWVGETSNTHRLLGSEVQEVKKGFVPYGIISTVPDAGILEGFTDVFITGKGFRTEGDFKPLCRFGSDSKSVVVAAEVLDYTRMICRSPKWAAESEASVHIGVSFGDSAFRPWTVDSHRFHYYKQPHFVSATPAVIDVRKKTEIYVTVKKSERIYQPIPTSVKGTNDIQVKGHVSCSFGKFGQSMGMYLNATTILCLSPHFSGNADDYSEEDVRLAIALNGQDYLEATSSAQVTFVGTGHSFGALFWVMTTVLVAILILAVWMLIQAGQPKPQNLPNVNTSLRVPDQLQQPRDFAFSRQFGSRQQSNLGPSRQ